MMTTENNSNYFLLDITNTMPDNRLLPQPRSQGLSSSRPQERERERDRLSLSLALGGGKKRDPGNEVAPANTRCISPAVVVGRLFTSVYRVN